MSSPKTKETISGASAEELERVKSKVDVFSQPLCLISTDEDNILKVDDDVVQELAKLDDMKPLVVVAIAGLYRTGKSYMMNKLANKNTGN